MPCHIEALPWGQLGPEAQPFSVELAIGQRSQLAPGPWLSAGAAGWLVLSRRDA